MIAREDLEDFETEAALAEARRRWGPNGAVSFADQYRRSRLLVGELIGGRFFIRGRGSTWDRAFADADVRAVIQSRRKA